MERTVAADSLSYADPSTTRRADLVVHVSARPYGRKTFVYYNAGSMLGTTPLSIRFPRTGRHRLVFWTPSLGRRVTRWVEVGRGDTPWVSVTMGPDRNLAMGRSVEE